MKTKQKPFWTTHGSRYLLFQFLAGGGKRLKYEASLVYTESWKPAWAIEWESISVCTPKIKSNHSNPFLVHYMKFHLFVCLFPARLWESDDNHWTKHGWEELLHKTGCTDCYHGSDRFLCSCRGSNNWDCGCHFHTVSVHSLNISWGHIIIQTLFLYTCLDKWVCT